MAPLLLPVQITMDNVTCPTGRTSGCLRSSVRSRPRCHPEPRSGEGSLNGAGINELLSRGIRFCVQRSLPSVGMTRGGDRHAYSGWASPSPTTANVTRMTNRRGRACPSRKNRDIRKEGYVNYHSPLFGRLFLLCTKRKSRRKKVKGLTFPNSPRSGGTGPRRGCWSCR